MHLTIDTFAEWCFLAAAVLAAYGLGVASARRALWTNLSKLIEATGKIDDLEKALAIVVSQKHELLDRYETATRNHLEFADYVDKQIERLEAGLHERHGVGHRASVEGAWSAVEGQAGDALGAPASGESEQGDRPKPGQASV